MPRNVVPQMRLHKPSGNAYVRLGGRMVYLGRWGSSDARTRYERAVAEWFARDRTPPPPKEESPAVAEVLSAFLKHAAGYYRALDGSPTGEARNFADAARPLYRLYGDLPADGFGVRELKAVRAAMVASGLSRKVVNARVNRIRRIWKWAAAEGAVPASAYLELQALDPLRKNRTEAREAPPVEPVPESVVRATLPHMPRPVAAMAELQLLTGCRVGEVVAMRAGDVDRTCDPWEYRPGRHKTDYREDARARVIPLGPRARTIVERFLEGRGEEEHLFDPRDAAAEASRECGSPRRPSARIRPCYDRRSYAQAIRRACDRAFPHPVLSKLPRTRTKKLTADQRKELAAWRERHRWSPLQLRHAAGTKVRRLFGLEASQAVLGHARADVTQLYAERLDGEARKVAAAIG